MYPVIGRSCGAKRNNLGVADGCDVMVLIFNATPKHKLPSGEKLFKPPLYDFVRWNDNYQEVYSFNEITHFIRNLDLQTFNTLFLFCFLEVVLYTEN